ncbi:MAG: heavy-metal-associated domain-containing protein [Flavobacteriaceae bacterium]|nr:heavy-metal-associated domain-containing protein [Flavobacteriaceae bacterium]
MKTIFLSLIMISISTLSFSQNKNAKASIKVDGVCMMCKNRIEKASLKTKGVKSAVWDVDTHELRLIFDENKTDLISIQKNIAGVGHDTKELKATDEAYNGVHPCCKYREDEVVKEHN